MLLRFPNFLGAGVSHAMVPELSGELAARRQFVIARWLFGKRRRDSFPRATVAFGFAVALCRRRRVVRVLNVRSSWVLQTYLLE